MVETDEGHIVACYVRSRVSALSRRCNFVLQLDVIYVS